MSKLKFDMGMWGKNGPTSLDYDFHDLYFSSAGSPEIRPGFSTGGSLYASASVYAGLNYDMGFGLVGQAKLELGGIKGRFDFDANGTTSQAADAWLTGAYVDTSDFTVNKSEIDVSSFDIEKSFVKVDLAAKLKADLHVGFSYEAGVDIPGIKINVPFVGDVQITPDIRGSTSGGDSVSTNLINLDARTNLIDVSGKALADGWNYDFLYGAVGAALPKVTYGAAEYIDNGAAPDSIHIHGESNPFLTASLDIDALVLAAFGLPPQTLSGSFGIDIGVAHALVNYQLLDARLTANASLEQDFLYTPDVTVSMTSSFGETIEDDIGGDFHFETPEGEGKFKVTATYDIDGLLTSTTNLKLASSFDWALLGGNAEAAVGVDLFGYHIGGEWDSGHFQLAGGSEPLGGGATIALFSDTSEYDLGQVTRTYTVHYENFVTAASGRELDLTTHQVTVQGGEIDNVINGNALANYLYGRGGSDVIYGNNGGDFISGDGGWDEIYAGGGRDTICTGYGGRLSGGKGADTFLVLGFAKDRIVDFNVRQGDKFDFRSIDADISTEDHDAFSFIGTSDFSGDGGEIRIDVRAKNTFVVFDLAGVEGVGMYKLDGRVDLNDASFLL